MCVLLLLFNVIVLGSTINILFLFLFLCSPESSLKPHSPVYPFPVDTDSAATSIVSADDQWTSRLAPTSVPAPTSTTLYSQLIQN